MEWTILSEKFVRCRFCGKTVAELLADGWGLYAEDREMKDLSNNYYNPVCPLCDDALEAKLTEFFSDDRFLLERMEELLSRFLLRLGSALSNDEKVEKIVKGLEKRL